MTNTPWHFQYIYFSKSSKCNKKSLADPIFKTKNRLPSEFNFFVYIIYNEKFYQNSTFFTIEKVKKRPSYDGLFGAPSGIRTRDPMQHSPQTKLRGWFDSQITRKQKLQAFWLGVWCTFRDSNPGPNATFAAGEIKRLV